MAKGIKVCKICGAKYPYCKTVVPEGVFRWQDVACCEEHGLEYLKKIMASRGETNEEIRTVWEETDEIKCDSVEPVDELVVDLPNHDGNDFAPDLEEGFFKRIFTK